VLLRLALLCLRKRQSRREESSLVAPNKRRATRSGAFLGATRGAGQFLSPAALSFAHVDILHSAHSALLDIKIVDGSANLNSTNRP